VVEALIPHGMIPTLTPNIFKVIATHYMLWMGIDMEPPPCCYHHTCGIAFGKSAEIMDHCWVPNDTIMQWLRLSSHME
jgi:hypothetical protein